MQGNTRLSYLAERDCEERAERRRRVSGWKSRLRWRKPLEAHLARPLWEEFLLIQALHRAALAIHRAERGEGQTALDAADRWLTLAHRWADHG